ncbi:MAG: cystathionine gamma-synthase [Caldilineae bacterium]|nr:cystathionine gamma-synthase [Chloroflexota bacterium]MCB9177401.1 cystathionine gamma-synthase [Caldilineae bacterium]
MSHGFSTRAIHAGQAPDPSTGAVIVPIYQTSTYAQAEVGQHQGYEYSRTGNPTRTAYEAAMAAVEEGAWGLAFASGMAAIGTILYLLAAGDHVVAADDLYGGTYRLFDKVARRYGIGFDFVDMRDPDRVAAAIRPETRMVWVETPTNPMLKIVDIAAVAERARAAGAITVVDNTFASPFLQQPLTLGADLVMHSATKYIGGHSDIVGGIVVGRDEGLREQLAFLQNAAGAVPGPMDCWLALRGLKTLALRMARHSSSGMAIAEWLEDLPQVEQVIYPGLDSHPGHRVAARQMRGGFGGMVSFTLTGGEEAARRVVARTELFTLAESLGGVESLIELPSAMTHMSVQGSPLAVPPGLVRISVGIEDLDDLMADLDQALA